MEGKDGIKHDDRHGPVGGHKFGLEKKKKKEEEKEKKEKKEKEKKEEKEEEEDEQKSRNLTTPHKSGGEQMSLKSSTTHHFRRFQVRWTSPLNSAHFLT